jgi:hypothetical protein
MALSDADVAEFQKLYKKRFGIELNKQDAYEKGIKLLRLMANVYKPMTKEEHEHIGQHRQATAPLLADIISRS